MKKRISILGSTGSIGTQALEVIDKLKDRFEITALSGGSNIKLLKEQAEKYSRAWKIFFQRLKRLYIRMLKPGSPHHNGKTNF